MKKEGTKVSLIVSFAFVAGVILTVFSYQATTIYQLRAQMANDHATLAQVVDFINQGIQAQQAQLQQAQSKTAPVTTQTTPSVPTASQVKK
ncbi:MAG: hypothetical protein PHG25_02235 [Candidatus Pacebacteria bacterium]|nr:hypothetical protein [Candidatus Paceibacterota bacterium]